MSFEIVHDVLFGHERLEILALQFDDAFLYVSRDDFDDGQNGAMTVGSKWPVYHCHRCQRRVSSL